MTAPTNYFYDSQVRRWISAFIRQVSNFYVEFGKDSNGATTFQRIPVMYGDPSRQAAQIVRQNSENMLNSVPAFAVYIDSFDFDQARLQDPSMVQTMSIRQRSFDPVTGTFGQTPGQNYTVERVMPMPYKLTMKLDIWSSNTEQKLQIVEQLSQLFRPAMEIQCDDNYVDWASLSYALLTGTTWTSRTVPVGADEPIDVATFKIELPIWLSTSIKVKRLGVIQTIIANYQELPDFSQFGPQQLITFEQYGILVNSNVISGSPVYTIKLLQQSDIVTENFDSIDITSSRNAWRPLLDLYGNYVSGSSEIRLMQPDGSEIIGTVANNPSDQSELIFSPFEGTTPANTLDPISAIIDPQSVNVVNYLTNPAVGTTYLLVDDIGSFSNPEGALAWRGTDGVDLVAHTNDIVQYNGHHWTVIFDSQNNDQLQYVTNLTTGIQYKWHNNQWTKSFDGVYPAGLWALAV